MTKIGKVRGNSVNGRERRKVVIRLWRCKVLMSKIIKVQRRGSVIV